MRVCSKCKKEKPADADHFSFIKSRNKWHPWCKPCCAGQRRADRAANPERYAEIERKRFAKDGEKRRALNRKIWAANAAKYRANSQERRAERAADYEANRQKRIKADPAYAERLKRQRQTTYERHGEKYKEHRRSVWATASAQRRLRTYFTSAICHSLKGTTKGGRSWETMLGYTAKDLREHLERQFDSGMSWDNYGEWHVDHIVPVSSFTFESADEPQFRACWALPNLRPMWAADNIRKGGKRLHLI